MDMTPLAGRAFAGLLESRTGQQLVAGRHWRLEAALGPIMRRLDIGSLDGLAACIGPGGDTALIDEVVEAMLNHETFFYRDLAAFQAITAEALTALAARRPERRLRIWSAGCSTGQEAYSLALMLNAESACWQDWRIDLIATDVSPVAIAQARSGLYSQFEAQRGLPIKTLIANFAREGEAWRLHDTVRARVAFQVHNLLDPPPAGRFDLILCRNVLLYFAAEKRAGLYARLAQAIAPDGLLMLGAGETVLGHTDLFEPDMTVRGFHRLARG